MSLPAALGGIPTFSHSIPFMQPTLPSFENIQDEMRSVMKSGMLTKGMFLKEYEQKLSEYLGTEYAIAVSSCTIGLTLTLKALGITGEVLVPSFTFCASAHSIAWAGAKPVFVDCSPDSYTLDVEDAYSKISQDTEAILAVHVFGVPAEVKKIEQFASKHNLRVIFDAAHAMGSSLDNKKIGTNGDAEVFSTSPTKTLVTGEGGIVATNNSQIAEYLKIIREYGNPGNYNCLYKGINARLSETAAILGCHSLQMLEENVLKRNAKAQQYRDRLREIPGLKVQHVPEKVVSTFKDLSIEVDPKKFGLNRDQLEEALHFEGIPVRKYFSPAVHQQSCYAPQQKLPVTELVASRILCLPLYAHMPIENVNQVIMAIQRIHNNAEQIISTPSN